MKHNKNVNSYEEWGICESIQQIIIKYGRMKLPKFVPWLFIYVFSGSCLMFSLHSSGLMFEYGSLAYIDEKHQFMMKIGNLDESKAGFAKLLRHYPGKKSK